MPLTVRFCGKVWHARGTIRVGRDTIPVPSSALDRVLELACKMSRTERQRASEMNGEVGVRPRKMLG